MPFGPPEVVIRGLLFAGMGRGAANGNPAQAIAS
jgi:hypothetical protein